MGGLVERHVMSHAPIHLPSRPPNPRPGIISVASLFEVVGYNERSRYYFIASVLNKPLVQVLLRGHEVTIDGSVCVVLLPTGSLDKMPRLCTGHQAFQECCLEWLSDQGSLPSSMDFWVCSYTLNPFGPLLRVNDVCRSKQVRFSVEKPSREHATKARLPFGFKKRKRKYTRKSKAKATGSKKQACEGHAAQSSLDSHSQRCQEVKGELGMIADPRVASDPEEGPSDAECDSSSSSSSDDRAGDDTEADADVANALKLAEEPVVTPQAKADAEDISKLEVSRQERIQNAESKKPPAPGKTRCNSSLGLIGASMQTAARLATCRHCLLKIERHTPRFSYAWSHSKFHSYLHTDCVVPHLDQDGADMGQATTFVTSFLEGSGRDAIGAELYAAAQSVKQQLGNTPAGAA